MKQIYKEVMAVNAMEDNDEKEAAARAFFEKLNAMPLPEHFNWADEIFEGLHVKERGDKPALVWTDIATEERRLFSYREFAARGNQCLNAVRKAGVEKGDIMLRVFLCCEF